MATPKRKHIKFKLTVIKFAEQNSGEATARHFGIDPKRVRKWLSKKLNFNVCLRWIRRGRDYKVGIEQNVCEELEVDRHQVQMEICLL